MLSTLTNELGVALVTEDGALELLADGHEEPEDYAGVPSRPRGLVYHRTTGVLEWTCDGTATEYRVYAAAGPGYPLALAATVADTQANVGALQPGAHRTFRVAGYNALALVEGPPTPLIHAAGPGRKL